MSDLVVIVPSRGRPQAARELAQAFQETCTADTDLVFALDSDDPLLLGYAQSLAGTEASGATDEHHSMVEALNKTALKATNNRDVFAVGFLGDDHRPRTKGWDESYLSALRDLGTGIVYGDDLFQRQNLPTQCAMTADIVRTLGYMAPPTLIHLAVDNWWLDLGRAAHCIRYLPDVVVEHMHPVAGKAEWDEGYIRVNAREMYERDLTEMARLRRESLPVEAARIRKLAAR